jgi:hypothetical protein
VGPAKQKKWVAEKEANDDVRIYNRALTAAEVKQLYNLGTVTIHPN